MQYRGLTYTCELDCDGDTSKRIHMLEGRHIDFCPYTDMDMETLAMIIELAAYTRLDSMSRPWDKHSVSKFYLQGRV